MKTSKIWTYRHKLRQGRYSFWVKPTTGTDEMVITTAQGQGFILKNRTFGLWKPPVRGIKLKKDDSCWKIQCLKPKRKSALIISENGFGKELTQILQDSKAWRKWNKNFQVTTKTENWLPLR